MTLLTLICVFVLEQLRPLGNCNRVWAPFTRYANYLERNLNAGTVSHGGLAWCIALLPPVLAVWLLYTLCFAISPVLAWVWNGVVLYMTMGFRHFSSPFSQILHALAEGRELDARSVFREWTGQPCADTPVSEIARLAIEKGVVDSYRYVFGTMFWFIVLPGPLGALLFRLATLLNQKWGQRVADDDAFGTWAKRAMYALDWLPVRFTALSFAIMGNLEDALYCWRSHVKNWKSEATGILLAAAAGAIGVRLGGTRLLQDGYMSNAYRFGLGTSDEADFYALKRAVGLIWRSVLLWLGVMVLLSFVH